MDFDFSLSPSDAHPETMDFLSHAWCNFAVKALQPQPQHGSIVLVDYPMNQLDPGSPTAHPSMGKSARMDDAGFRSLPPWKSNDVKSWLWMQQAMHPELNYNSSFRKKWMPWKQIIPLKSVSIKKWFKEIKLRRKEEQRLEKAEVHATLSIAGVAAALAVVAADKSDKESNEDRDAAIASAAALVAAQCAKVAEAMGVNKEQLGSVIGSAMSGTSATDILTLTASAATWKYMPRSVSVILNSEAKVVLMMRKRSLLKSKKESIVVNLQVELYKDSESDDGATCYLIVLTTRGGTFKLDMASDFRRYKTWATTIKHMLRISTSLAKYELQFY